MARGSASSADGTSSVGSGLPIPKGARRSSSSASPRCSASPGHDGVHPLDGQQVRRAQHRRGVLRERLAEGRDAVPADREAGGGAMPAVAQEVGGGRVEPAEEIEGRDGAPRAGSLLTVERDQDRGAVMALGDPRGDDADHAGVPALGRQHVRRRRARGGDLRLRLEEDPRLHVAALGVHGVQLGGDGGRARDVGGEEELEAGIGAMEAPGGVDAGREAEADGAGVHPARIDARHLHQGLEAGLAGGGERAQAGPDQPSVLAHERDDVGHGGERDHVEVGVGGPRVHPDRVEQRLGELVRDPGGAQLRARVAADPRMDDRGVRQPAVGARRVVVRDHDVHPGGAGRRDLLHRGDRAVDGDQQLGPAGGQLVDRRGGEPVAVVDAAGQVPVDVGSQRPQGAHEHRRRAHPVDVVVAVHGDPRTALHVPDDGRRAFPQASERVERVPDVGRQEPAGGAGIGEAAADEHLGGRVRDVQRVREAHRGGVLVGGDVEADVRGHGSGTVRSAADGIGGRIGGGARPGDRVGADRGAAHFGEGDEATSAARGDSSDEVRSRERR